MAESTAIEWTDATVNFWWGCTKVSPGCDHCYAEAWNKFRGNGAWGLGAPRRKIEGASLTLQKLSRKAARFEAAHGRRMRVFVQSMSDSFDKEIARHWRAELFEETSFATGIDIQLLTKRIGNVEPMIPEAWKAGHWPRHVGLMITIVDQAEADRDVPKLIALKARLGIAWVGVSAEPLLGPIDFGQRLRDLDWIIVGGESGPAARPMHPDWVRSIRDQCAAAGLAFLFKQHGEWIGVPDLRGLSGGGGPGFGAYDHCRYDQDLESVRVGKRRSGRRLDGVTHDDFPQVRR